MIEPVFPNAVRRAIADVTHGSRLASILQDKVALHQAAMLWDHEDGAEPADLLALAEHPKLARGTLSCFVPDIVSRTIEAGIDPAETLRFFDLAQCMSPGPPADAFWAGSDMAFAAGWVG